MILGHPLDFSIHFDVIFDNDSLPLGMFNFIFDEKLFPGEGCYFTINMIINHLEGNTEDIINSPLLDEDLINSKHFYSKLAHSVGIILATDPSDFELDLENTKRLGVDLTPLEFLDLGYYIFYSRTTKKDIIYYSKDYGLNYEVKLFEADTINSVLSLLVCGNLKNTLQKMKNNQQQFLLQRK